MSYLSDKILRAFLLEEDITEVEMQQRLSRAERTVYIFVGASVALLALVLTLIIILPPRAAYGHDHVRPDLNNWYQSLRSDHGPCCDGPKTDALHLIEVDWETQDKGSSHYRVRIPRNGPDFHRAIQGETVETEWVDVPDDAVIHEPNLAGETTVWPLYGYMGNTIRCFIPGTLS